MPITVYIIVSEQSQSAKCFIYNNICGHNGADTK